jgi:hypothetical protein
MDAVLWKKQEHFEIHGFAKSGLFYDDATQSTAFSNPGSLGTLSADAGGGHASYLVEVGLVASQQINEHAFVRFSYEAMWIDGVALAARQIPNTDLLAGTAEIETSGSVFYHGASIGLEINW